MRNNPYVLGLVIVLAGFLYIKGDDTLISNNPKLGKTIFIKTPKVLLDVEPSLLQESFHAHEYDQTARSLKLTGPENLDLKCSMNGGKSFSSCAVGDKISWSKGAYRSGINFQVRDQLGNIVQFKPKRYNPNLSFHRCDRYLKSKTTERTLRNVVSKITDRNDDGMKIICLGANQTIDLYEGPLKLTRHMAIIGTHKDTPMLRSMGDFPVFKNENKTLFLYNLNVEAGTRGSYGLSLGVGSYLGADNLSILVSSKNSEGIHCFGCTIDGDRVKVKTLAANSRAISSSLGLLELRWAKLTVNGENSLALKTDMGSFTNVLEDSIFVSNDTGPALEMKESGMFFSTGTIEQNGATAAIYLSDLDSYKNEFNELTVKSNSIGFMIKNAKNVFLNNIKVNSKGARLVNLGSNRISQN